MSQTQAADKTKPLLDRVAEDIQKSGFPLELHVLNICSSRNTGRLPSVRYEYLGQLREIDLITNFETIKFKSSQRNAPQHTVTSLIIECKKSSSKPWVFFTSEDYAFREFLVSYLHYVSEFDLHFKEQAEIPLLARIVSQVKLTQYANSRLAKCVSYYEAFRDKDRPSDIYKAVDSVITYLSYSHEIRKERREEFGVFSNFFLPVIVLEGDLMEASLIDNAIKVVKKKHLQLRTLHREKTYLIDIVTKDHFSDFLAEIENFHDGLVSAISSLEFPRDYLAKTRAKMKSVELDPETEGEIAISTAEFAYRKIKAAILKDLS